MWFQLKDEVEDKMKEYLKNISHDRISCSHTK